MGRQELALALKQRGEAEGQKIWQQVEAEAEQYRSGKQQEVARMNRACDLECAQNSSLECLQLEWRVAKKTRQLRLTALHALDRRIWLLAKDELSRLDPELRQQALSRFAEEIPGGAWCRVWAAPDDVGMVQALFPDCQIDADATLAGGLVVASEDGKIRIDNSLTKRLETLWPELVGQILADLESRS